MTRYITRSAKPLYIETPLWGDDESLKPNLAVSDHSPTFTGLVDARGDEIWKAPNPMGFGRDEDWA